MFVLVVTILSVVCWLAGWAAFVCFGGLLCLVGLRGVVSCVDVVVL